MKQAQLYTALVLLLLAPLGASAEHNPLLPQPQEIHYGSGVLAVRGLEIRLPSDAAAEDRFAAEELSSSLSRILGSPIFISEGGTIIRRVPRAIPGEWILTLE